MITTEKRFSISFYKEAKSAFYWIEEAAYTWIISCCNSIPCACSRRVHTPSLPCLCSFFTVEKEFTLNNATKNECCRYHICLYQRQMPSEWKGEMRRRWQHPTLPRRIWMPRGNFYLGQFFKEKAMQTEKNLRGASETRENIIQSKSHIYNCCLCISAFPSIEKLYERGELTCLTLSISKK